MATKTKAIDESSIINLEDISEVWRVVYKGPLSQEVVLILADGPQMALEKATNYQNNYTIICDWPITSLERISTTVF